MQVRRAQQQLTDAVARRASAAARAVEARIGLTSTGIGVALLAVLVYLLARLLSNLGLFMLTYGGVVVIGLAYVLARRKLSIETHRSELPSRVRAGQTVTVKLDLETKRALSTVVIEEHLHERLGDDVKVPVASLAAGGTVTHEYTFTPTLRGIYTVGPLVATWSDPFGLTKRTAVLAEATTIIVHPRTENAQDRVFAREWEDPPVRPPVTKPWPSGYEFYGMRDYVSGDDPRRIVWRATARTLDLESGTGRYLVRESEQGITDRVTVLLDTDRAAHSPGDPSETFETGVKVAASLASKHVKDGFTVTMFSNAERLHRPVRSQREGIRLLDELAGLQLTSERLVTGVERLLRNPRRDTHMVVITPHLDSQSTARLKLLIDRGISVILVLVQWDDTDPVTQHRAGQLGCTVVEVTSNTSLEGAFRHIVSRLVSR
ncbi:MAG: hypothetical protein QOK42_2845 [Frankiaceae bacterium]|nr:hypothetical protein [Frankiaceae bacterium]MDX6273362.1 hypothetical protein [Frankiales bacterium]